MNKGILFSVCLLIFLTACRLSKNVPKNQYLLKKVEVNLTQEGSILSASDLYSLLRQQPNQKVMGIPIRLIMYNAVDSAKVAKKRGYKNDKLTKTNAKRIQKMDHVNTRRIAQARAKGQDFYSQKIIPLKDTLNPTRFFREWLKYKYGERPVIYDSTLYGISQSQLLIFLRKKGFYESQISPQILNNPEKRTVTLRFDVSAGLPYRIDSVSAKGPTSLTNFYKAFLEDEQKKNSEHPLIGKPLDEDMLATQAEEVARHFRNFGLYGFTGDNVRYEVDTNARSKRAKVLVQFLPRKVIHPEIKDSLVVVPFERYLVNRVFFHLSDSNNVTGSFDQYKSMKRSSNEGGLGERGFLETYESLTYAELKCDKKAAKRFKLTKSDINPYRVVEVYFNGEKPGVRPHLLELQNYLEPTNVYKDKYVERSYQFLNQLDLFTAIKPVLKENVGKKSVDVHYYLTQSKIQSFAFEPRFTSSFGLLGVNASLNYQNKNVFRGGERLSISLGGGFDSQPVVFADGITEGRTFNTFEFGPNIKLEIPGLFPVPVWIISKRQKPSTVFNAAANVEHRDIFDRSVLQFSYTWKWLVGKTQVFTVGLPGMSTVKFVQFKKDNFFEAQINALNDLFLRNSYSNQLIWEDFKFQFDWSNVKKDFRADEGHSARKILADLRYFNSTSLAGNTLRRFSNHQDTLAGGIQTVFGNAFAQFFRTDHQFTLIRRFKSNLQFAGKMSAGLGVPYGNSTTSMPYDYSFFGGGPNDNRGWKARSLGPGAYRGYRDSTGTVTQLGDIRLFGSLEFRFPLGGMLSSCVFSDFGNIWTYRKDDNREGAEFTKDFYKQLAFTLGTGLRIDLSILIVRVDIGFPIFNPALPGQSKWIFKPRDAYYLDGAQYYGYTTGTSQEQMQKAKERLPRPFIPSLNFGIGLPF
jgi:outer membrane protein assembly factor BamA